MEIAAQVIDRITAWLTNRHRTASEQRRAYLQEVLAACQAVVTMEPAVTDSELLLQQRLRAFYADLAENFSPHPRPMVRECAIRALGHARILFWVRLLEHENDGDLGSVDELRELFERVESKPLGLGFASWQSLKERLVPLDGQEMDSLERQRALEELKRGCLLEISKLEVAAKHGA